MIQRALKKFNISLPELPFKFDGNKRWVILAGVAVAATAIIISLLWNSTAGYVALFGNQENLPVSQIITVLDGEKLEYRIDPSSGQILVPESSLSHARMALAAKGVQAILPSGYELMDKDEVLGSSQFVQNIRYKRSLEGELAQSIMTLDAVESARVQLALNEESSFVVSSQPENSASVVVRLHYGKKLDMDQVNAIVHLVAGSIPGLKTSRVSVVDQQGHLLSDGVTSGELTSATTRKHDQILQDIQQKTQASLANVLNSLVGENNYRISVMPNLDLSSVDETQEHFGDAPKVNHEENSQDTNTDQLALGVPGSLSNRPPVANNATVTNGQGANAAQEEPKAFSKHSDNKRDYVWDRTVKHIQHPDFTIKQIDVAVVLNENSPALKGWKKEQFDQVTTMLNDAAGLDTTRGDRLSLTTLTFVPETKVTLPTLPWWQNDDILQWVRLIGSGLLALLLLVFVVRPIIKRITAVRPAMVPELANTVSTSKGEFIEASMTEAQDEERRNVELPFSGDDGLPAQSSGLETKLEFLQKLAMSDTDRVAEVIRQWITSNERIDNK